MCGVKDVETNHVCVTVLTVEKSVRSMSAAAGTSRSPPVTSEKTRASASAPLRNAAYKPTVTASSRQSDSLSVSSTALSSDGAPAADSNSIWIHVGVGLAVLVIVIIIAVLVSWW